MMNTNMLSVYHANTPSMLLLAQTHAADAEALQVGNQSVGGICYSNQAIVIKRMTRDDLNSPRARTAVGTRLQRTNGNPP